MKLVLHIVAIILALWIFLFISCKKEYSCEGCRGLILNDTVPAIEPSPDCNGNIRNQVVAQLIPLSVLSIAREGIAVASAGNKILFAGGAIRTSANTSSRVDIYNISSNTWSTAELSQARAGMVVAVSGNKIFFAGGETDKYEFYEFAFNLSSRVDVYDVVADSWSMAELSEGRGKIAAGVSGNKVLFAGGYSGIYQLTTDVVFSNKVDILNTTSGSWSAASLSQARCGLTATAVNNKIYFAGGSIRENHHGNTDYDVSSRIDLYDAMSDSWSASSLFEIKGWHAAIAVNNNIYWAGGRTYTNTPLYFKLSDLVEIHDVNTQSSSFACLFQPNAKFNAVLKDNKIIFFTGEGETKNKFDIYDITTNKWSIAVLPVKISDASIISVNNTIYVAGGYVNGSLSNVVWKLEF